MAISYPYELDRERTDERLASFFAKVIKKSPVDTEFQKRPLLDILRSKRKKTVGAQPMSFPVGYGESPNFRRGDPADLYAVVASSGTSKMMVATYDFVDMYDKLVISGREQRELSEPRLIDRMKYKHDLIVKTNILKKAEDLFAAAEVDGHCSPLPVAIDSTGTFAGVNPTTVTGWASQETDHSSAFAVGGYEAMIAISKDIQEVGGMTDIIVCPKDLHADLEMSYDADIRYSSTKELDRAADGIKFRGTKVIFDSDCTANAMYFLDLDSVYIMCNSQADMKFEGLVNNPDQDAMSSFFLDEFQVVIEDRRVNGKIINMT